MRIQFRREVRGVRPPPIPAGFKPWLILAIAVLLGGLFLLVCVVVASFVYFDQKGTPLWVVLLGVVAVLGIGIGFLGLFGLMAAAGYRVWREDRRVQVLPPVTGDSDEAKL